MIHLYTALTDKSNLIVDVEMEFMLQLKFKNRHIFDDEICNDIIRDIDGLEWRQGPVVFTRFGETSLSDLSTGCKGALLAIKSPDLIINSAEFGNNAFAALVRRSKGRTIRLFVTHTLISAYEPGTKVVYDGRRMSIDRAMDIMLDTFDPLP